MLLFVLLLATLAQITITHGQETTIQFNTNYRSTSDIVWSCLITVFACSWISVHPNVAGYNSTWWQRYRARLELMIWALVAPELIILWAYRQWLGARQLAAELGGKWTTTHAHFFQMGGFIFKEGNRVEYIGLDWLRLTNTDVTMLAGFEAWMTRSRPRRAMKALNDSLPTVPELADRSKGDPLTKTVVILQTFWFILQCLARKIQGLPTTEIEVITLAYAALTGVIYYFWWDKPLDVQCPIVVEIQPDDQPPHLELLPGTRPPPPPPETLSRSHSNTVVRGFFRAFNFRFILRRLDDIGQSLNSTMVYSNTTSLSLFFAAPTTDRMDSLLQIVAACLASGFGAIHMAAWAFFFPSATTQFLWRISSLCITVSPLAIVPPRLYAYVTGVAWSWEDPTKPVVDRGPGHGYRKAGGKKGWALMWSMRAAYCALVLYLPARIVLLVLAFMQLGRLTAGHHQTVEWTSFFPHVG
ncbi:hypothetical protein FA15DRAFT_669338 [Coprinopsis marcescibilis]|uniref:Wax synthase domain-containing protein n=1 Tax=Coprinopsis marcescibilis TaxID=230819 RepID=A0A5C3KW20_COPMA|nr:hypothetical protein FA15DRAFT_669338 [Coprinopsis marcescibilis]